MKVLVIENDPFVSIALENALSGQNYAVDKARDGRSGLEMVAAFEYDLIALALQLPDLDGIEVCRQIRSGGHRTPILALTENNDRSKIILALDTGADDCLVKPFDRPELMARARALLRRGKGEGTPVLEWGDLRLVPDSHEVTYAGHSLALGGKEYAIVEFFLRGPRQIWTPAGIVGRVWASDRPRGEEIVRYYIKEIRKKIQTFGGPFDLIETIYGVGYRLNPRYERGAFLSPESRVLLITDDRPLASEIEAFLAPRKTIVAAGAEEYRRILETESIALALVDADIPDAVEACRALHRRQCPIVAIVPTPSLELLAPLFDAGASDFMAKPVPVAELATRIAIRLPRPS